MFSAYKPLAIFLILLLTMACEQGDEPIENIQDEVSIFNQSGIPIAYSCDSDNDEYIIYLWNGTPTSFYTKANNNLLYGFNGQFLGWRESGVYYDLDGNRIGFEEGALDILTQEEPIKSIKEQLPIKSTKEITPTTPNFNSQWSSVELQDFFLQGIE